ncbi:MAG: hypothetical protein KAK00_04125 [Nanoarchaeota archaeon]|nr:hypothetical protein [Thermodesulfovibrionia bacterium]MCK5282570.1 hypothetical protein [Nanoarchaeota archaeon]
MHENLTKKDIRRILKRNKNLAILVDQELNGSFISEVSEYVSSLGKFSFVPVYEGVILEDRIVHRFPGAQDLADFRNSFFKVRNIDYGKLMYIAQKYNNDALKQLVSEYCERTMKGEELLTYGLIRDRLKEIYRKRICSMDCFSSFDHLFEVGGLSYQNDISGEDKHKRLLKSLELHPNILILSKEKDIISPEIHKLAISSKFYELNYEKIADNFKDDIIFGSICDWYINSDEKRMYFIIKADDSKKVIERIKDCYEERIR